MDLLSLFRKTAPSLEEDPDHAVRPSPARLWLRQAFTVAEERPAVLLPLAGLYILVATLLLASGRSASSPPAPLLPTLLGLLLLTSLVAVTLLLYVYTLQPKQFRTASSLLLLGTILLLSLALARSVLFLAHAVHTAFPHLPLSSLHYTLPVATGGVLLALLCNLRIACAGSAALAILTTLMTADSFGFFLLAVLGGLVGGFVVSSRPTGTTILRAGALVGLGNLFALLPWTLVTGPLDGRFLTDILCGLINGVLTALLTSGLLPLLESIFETASDFKLLELGNLNHPALKHTILTAPGTYHHSVLVGTLAEAAAEAVGANPLLCRVGAYYHDLGKTKHPTYFIENQMDAPNRHDKLAPRLSALIVMAHVKDGIEMAHQFGLPPAIVDMIPQHHGTRPVSFFYQKAKESEDPTLGEIPQETFRYPGPKPQTKEAAILMLADYAEAISRTLGGPSPARIHTVVERIITEIFLDGQLDECDLTLKDLHLIANSLTRSLTALHHHRVAYPHMQLEESPPEESTREHKGNGSHRPQSATAPAAEQPAPQKDRVPDPRVPGM